MVTDVVSPSIKEPLTRTDGPFAPEYQSEVYKVNNPDLRLFNEEQLLEHAINYGWSEGRIMSLPAMREHFVEIIEKQESVLEIGPFCNPITSRENVVYFDILDSAGLKSRAEKIGHPISRIPRIDYVSPTGDLSVVDRLFSAVTSSHCIEHQPDLIKHLQQVAGILEEGGYYFVIVPDKRYCFDHFIPESTIARVIEARVEKPRVHRLGSVIEHRALITHNDSRRHWLGDHSDPGYRESVTGRITAALQEFELARGSYIDVHAWQFTPNGFRDMIQNLYNLQFSPFRALRVYNTPRDRFEFCAILQKNR